VTVPVPTQLEQVDTKDLRRHCETRLTQLRNARQPWLDFCVDVATELWPAVLPHLEDPHSDRRGGQRNAHIADGVGHLALESSAAGITSGVMPAASEWFGLDLRNEFAADDDVRYYLQETERVLLTVHNQSNAAQALPGPMKEWVAFGTAAVLQLDDDEDSSRLEPFSIGEYCIAEDARGRVDTIYREYTLTVGQLADEFGVERLSPSSKRAWDDGDYDTVVPVVLAIEPDRDGRNPYGVLPELPWRSVYYEVGSDYDQVLGVRGFSRFPALVWRWGHFPGSAYGYGRGHDALPHLIRLHKMIYRYGQAVAQKADPSLQIPVGLAAHEVRRQPGGATTVMPGMGTITPLYRVELELRELAEEMERTRQDIRDTLGATLVASLRRINRQITAREADLRRNEDLAEFLPGLTRLNDELLAPYIEGLWDIADRRGLLPPRPASMEGQVVDIEMRSPLARRQRQQVVEAIVRTFAVAGELGKVPQLAHVLDNFDVDAAIRLISDIEGAPVSIMLSTDAVQQLRMQRAQSDIAQAQAAAAQSGVDLAKGVAETQAMAVS
jgi:hypothetical protein